MRTEYGCAEGLLLLQPADSLQQSLSFHLLQHARSTFECLYFEIVIQLSITIILKHWTICSSIYNEVNNSPSALSALLTVYI